MNETNVRNETIKKKNISEDYSNDRILFIDDLGTDILNPSNVVNVTNVLNVTVQKEKKLEDCSHVRLLFINEV